MRRLSVAIFGLMISALTIAACLDVSPTPAKGCRPGSCAPGGGGEGGAGGASTTTGSSGGGGSGG